MPTIEPAWSEIISPKVLSARITPFKDLGLVARIKDAESASWWTSLSWGYSVSLSSRLPAATGEMRRGHLLCQERSLARGGCGEEQPRRRDGSLVGFRPQSSPIRPLLGESVVLASQTGRRTDSLWSSELNIPYVGSSTFLPKYAPPQFSRTTTKSTPSSSPSFEPKRTSCRNGLYSFAIDATFPDLAADVARHLSTRSPSIVDPDY